MVKTVSPIVEPVAPIELPSNTVPSARIKNAFIFTPKKRRSLHLKTISL